MVSIYNIHEAKTHFSKLIEKARFGEEVIVAKTGKPVVKIVPVDAPIKQRQPGSALGMFSMGDDFDDPLPQEMLKAFYE